MGLFSSYSQAKAIRDLTERLDTAERVIKQLRAEWDDTYDKLRVTMGRIVKRAAVLDAEGDAPPRREPPATPPEPGNGRMLTPEQIQHQQRILRRRAGM